MYLGQFVKDQALTFPISIVKVVEDAGGVQEKTPVTGLSGGADLALKKIIKANGSATTLPNTCLVNAAQENGMYKFNVSAGVTDQEGVAAVTISGPGLQRQTIHFRLGDADLDAVNDVVSNTGVTLKNDALTAAKADSTFHAEVADAVLDEAMAGHVAAGTLGKLLNDMVTDIWASGSRTLTAFSGTFVDQIWDELTAGHAVAGSFGKLFVDNIDAVLSTIVTHLTQIKGAGWATETLVLLAANISSILNGSFAISTADKAAIADAVWDEALAAHLSAGKAGHALRAIRALALGKRKFINAGANEELYDYDNTTLVATFNITYNATDTDNIDERST